MRLTLPSYSSFLIFIVSSTITTFAFPLAKPTPGPSVCNPNAKGPSLNLQQEAAIKDFAQIFLVDLNPKKAFDKYVPGEYIQHNPNALSGREAAITYLTALQSTPGIIYTNITAFTSNTGLPNEFAIMHYRRRVPNTDIDYAVMDRLKFRGTCFFEHWDVVQRIFGNETNPIAFF